jgi:hypothetical protein
MSAPTEINDFKVKQEELEEEKQSSEFETEIIHRKEEFYCGDPSHGNRLYYRSLGSFKDHVRKYHNNISNSSMSHTSFGLPMSEENLKKEGEKRKKKAEVNASQNHLTEAQRSSPYPFRTQKRDEHDKPRNAGSKRDEDFRFPSRGRGKGNSKKAAI